MPGKLPDGRLSGGIVGTDDTLVTMPRWIQLAQTRAIVGQCRDCSGNLRAIEPDEHSTAGEAGEVAWYETRCDGCGKERAAPNGRVLRRSSLHTEMPTKWWETREGRDREQRHGAEG